MPKYNVTQRTLVHRTGKATIDIAEGVSPTDHVQQELNAGRDPYTWEETNTAYQSIEVEPIPEPIPEQEPWVSPPVPGAEEEQAEPEEQEETVKIIGG